VRYSIYYGPIVEIMDLELTQPHIASNHLSHDVPGASLSSRGVKPAKALNNLRFDHPLTIRQGFGSEPAQNTAPNDVFTPRFLTKGNEKMDSF
jgi:hypothetical protein